VLHSVDISRPPLPVDAANPDTRQLIATVEPDKYGHAQIAARFSRD
jgi:hypothetical protein